MRNSFSKLFFIVFALAFNCAEGQTQYKSRNLTVTDHVTNEMDEATLRKKMKEDGLTDPLIDKLIAKQKLYKKQGKVTWSSAKNTGQNPVVNAPCSDLGVENGWGAWQWLKGGNSGANPPVWTGAPALNPAVPDFTLTSGAGIDPNTPGLNVGDPTVPVVCPGFGSSSIKIGDDCNVGSVCQQLTYPLTVTAQDTNFVFAYAVVLEDAGHLPSEQPYCSIAIYDQAGNTIPCVPLIYTGGPSIPGFYDVNGAGCASTFGGQYKPWTLVGVNLTPYLGQNLTVVIENCDCIYGGHFAYSYWDFLCGTSQLSGGCVGNQSTICGPVDPNIAYTYQWFMNGNPIAPPQGTQQCITVTAQPGDTVTVEVQQPSGCNFHLMYVPATVQPSFTSTGTCGTYTFTSTSTASPSNVTITGYSWSFPGGTPTSATTQSATVTYSSPGTYTVALTVTCSAGCTATTQTVVTVNALPTAAINASPACLGNAVTLADASVSPAGDPITQWSWSMPGGNPATSTSQNASTVYSTAGPHTVTLTVTTQGGCTHSVPQQVVVYTPPVANFSGSGTGCAPVCVNNYTDLSTSTDGNITTWAWTFPGGSPSISNQQNPGQICYNTAGTYGASLIVISQYGCSDTINITPIVTPRPWPSADFCITPDGPASALTPVFNFCDMWSGDVTQWTWSFGDNDVNSSSTDPIHSYSAAITTNDFYSFTVCLYVQNQYGCYDSICKPVEIIPEFEFWIPNTFTPDGDYINELFFGKGRGIKEYDIWIFDRWGNMIWDCHIAGKNTDWDVDGQDGMSAACRWDGKVEKGGIDLSGGSEQTAQEDVYVWKVKLLDVFDKYHSYVGNVNIVR